MKPFQGQTAFKGAGDFRDRVVIQSRILNAGGDEIAGWAVFANTWAAVEPLIRNRQILLFQSDREVTIFDVVIRMRFLPGVDTTMTVLHGTTTYQIRDVADIASLGRELHLVCRAAR